VKLCITTFGVIVGENKRFRLAAFKKRDGWLEEHFLKPIRMEDGMDGVLGKKRNRVTQSYTGNEKERNEAGTLIECFREKKKNEIVVPCCLCEDGRLME
jgi:hypothetical protein